MRILLVAALAATLAAAGCTDPAPAPDASQEVAPPAGDADPSDAPAPDAAAPAAPAAAAPAPALANVTLPEPFASTPVSAGECMAFVDVVNGQPAAAAAPVQSGAEVSVAGWNIVAESQGVAPATIFAILKPFDPSAKGSVLVGKRTQRPDVAGDNKAYLMSGYEAVGAAPAAGRYRVALYTGTESALYECDTRVDITVQ